MQKKHITNWEKGLMTIIQMERHVNYLVYNKTFRRSVSTCCQTNLCNTIGNQSLSMCNNTNATNHFNYMLSLFTFSILLALLSKI